MNVEGLTRENVASHLQKYRLQLKKDHRLDDDGNLAEHPARPRSAAAPPQRRGGGRRALIVGAGRLAGAERLACWPARRAHVAWL